MEKYLKYSNTNNRFEYSEKSNKKAEDAIKDVDCFFEQLLKRDIEESNSLIDKRQYSSTTITNMNNRDKITKNTIDKREDKKTDYE